MPNPVQGHAARFLLAAALVVLGASCARNREATMTSSADTGRDDWFNPMTPAVTTDRSLEYEPPPPREPAPATAPEPVTPATEPAKPPVEPTPATPIEEATPAETESPKPAEPAPMEPAKPAEENPDGEKPAGNPTENPAETPQAPPSGEATVLYHCDACGKDQAEASTAAVPTCCGQNMKLKP